MVATDKLFAGSMPEIYQRFLVPLIFESCARDLAGRVAKTDPGDVLETAAGTGVLTRAIVSRFAGHARIVATDLNQYVRPVAMRNAEVGIEGDRFVIACDRFLAAAGIVLLSLRWAFAPWLPYRRLPRHRVRYLRLRLRLRLHPGAGHATLPELWLRWGRLAALRRSLKL